MEHLVKQVVFFSKTRRDALKTEAERLGITVSELVRRRMDELSEIKSKQEQKHD